MTEARLERAGVVNSRLAGVPVAWLRDSASGAVRAVRREREDRVVELSALEGYEPTEAVLATDPARGTLEELDVAGLAALRVDRAFSYAWARTVPGARLLTD